MSKITYLPVGYTKLMADDSLSAIHRLQLPLGWSFGVGNMLWNSRVYPWWHLGRFVWAMRGDCNGKWWQFRFLWFYVGRAYWIGEQGKRGA